MAGRPVRCLLLGLAAALLPGVGGAEVVASAAGGFVSEHELVLRGDPHRVFRALTAEIGAWWDATHSYSGDAANFILEARAGGCFCERLPQGGDVEHMRVVFAAPGERLRLWGGLGPLQAMGASGSMDFALTPEGPDQTRLSYRYAVHGFAPGGLAAVAEPVDRVQLGQLRRLADYLAADPSPASP